MSEATGSVRWHVTELGALLYGDDSGGITVAGLAVWQDSPERTEAIRALSRWCHESIESAAALAGSAPNPQGADERPIRSFEEYERTFFPEKVAKRERENETPEQLGRRIANEALGTMRAAAVGAPDEPTDDHLAELRGHVERYLSYSSQEGDDEGPLLSWLESRNVLAAALPGLLAEVERLRAAAPASEEWADGLPEHLYTDIESTIHQHCGHDGQSDEANDWVTDLMSAITPLIVRAAGSPPPTPAPTTLHGHVTDSEDFGSEHGDYTTLSIRVAGLGHDELLDHHVSVVDEGDVMDHPDWGRDPSEEQS